MTGALTLGNAGDGWPQTVPACLWVLQCCWLPRRVAHTVLPVPSAGGALCALCLVLTLSNTDSVSLTLVTWYTSTSCARHGTRVLVVTQWVTVAEGAAIWAAP